jgi:hypothetical protein
MVLTVWLREENIPHSELDIFSNLIVSRLKYSQY